MKVGVVLPHFRKDPAAALTVARRSDAAGVDGVFCYDHIWPMGQPDRPAIAPFPLLGAIGATTARVAIGTLVARIGLVANEVLVAQFRALDAVAPGRVVAGLGTGDRHSAEENRAYGIRWEPADQRRADLRRCASALSEVGMPVWVGGGAPATLAVARAVGVAVNLWAATPSAVAAQRGRTEVTWAGPAPRGRDEEDGRALLAHLVHELAEAGATWAVLGWPVDLEHLAALGAEVRG